MQMPPGSVAAVGLLLLITLLLCLEITLDMLVIVLYETFTVFLLMIGRREWPMGKQESMMVKKVEATLVLTALLKGGLNQVTVLFRHLRRGWLALSSTLGGMYVSLCL